MYRLLTPVLAVIVAITVFSTFVRPTFEEYRLIDAEVAEYEAALARAQELQDRINALIASKQAIAQSDVERLMTFLPDEQDAVAVVLLLDDSARRNRMLIEGISVKDSEEALSFEEEEAAQRAARKTDVVYDPDIEPALNLGETLGGTKSISSIPVTELYSPVDLSFTAIGEYEDFKALIQDLETSLVLMDISELAIEQRADDDLTNFMVTVTLYNFKNPLTE